MIDLNQYQVFYPGVYTDEEAEALGRLREELKKPAEAAGPMAQRPVMAL